MDEAVKARIAELTPEGGSWDPEAAALTLAPDTLVATVKNLASDPATDLVYLRNLTAYERYDAPGVCMVYHLSSIAKNHTIAIYVPLNEGALAVPSLVPVFNSADWQEREVFDMFGVHFIGHPDLRRILMEDTCDFYPLRKSYVIDPAVNVRNIKDREDDMLKAITGGGKPAKGAKAEEGEGE